MSNIYKQFGEYTIYSDGRVFSGKSNRFLKPFLTEPNKSGYLAIRINRKCYKIHKLVAELFIDNPENKSDVDHIDGNKLNNNVSNLRWATHRENANNINTTNGKVVICIEDNKEFPNSYYAGEYYKISSRWIRQICNKEKNSAYGLHFKYKEA